MLLGNFWGIFPLFVFLCFRQKKMILARACKEPVGRLKDTMASGPIKKGGGGCGKKQFLGTLGTEILLRDRCHGWIRLRMKIVLKALSSFLIIQTSKVLDYFKKY